MKEPKAEIFMDPRRLEDEDGLVALGVSLNTNSLLEAYSKGIFPWPIGDYPVPWFCPGKRAVLYFKDLRLNQTLQKFLKKHPYQITVNKAFKEVIALCASVPRGTGTWITEEILHAYSQFHRDGFAQSVEVWDQKELVGGLYGVYVKGVFCGESMFHLRPNTSKIAIVHLVELLKDKSKTWMDIQQLTPHMEKMGAKNLARNEFLHLLKSSQVKEETWA